MSIEQIIDTILDAGNHLAASVEIQDWQGEAYREAQQLLQNAAYLAVTSLREAN